MTPTLIVFATSLFLTNLLWTALLIWAIARRDNVSLKQTFTKEPTLPSESDLSDLFGADAQEILNASLPKPVSHSHVYEIEPEDDESPIA